MYSILFGNHIQNCSATKILRDCSSLLCISHLYPFQDIIIFLSHIQVLSSSQCCSFHIPIHILPLFSAPGLTPGSLNHCQSDYTCTQLSHPSSSRSIIIFKVLEILYKVLGKSQIKQSWQIDGWLLLFSSRDRQIWFTSFQIHLNFICPKLDYIVTGFISHLKRFAKRDVRKKTDTSFTTQKLTDSSFVSRKTIRLPP